MKKLFFIIALFFTCSLTYAQQTIPPKKVKDGELTNIVIYYDNGTIMQIGSYTEDGKLNGMWESFNEDGTKKCIAYYDYGIKTGTWIYWKNDVITKVTYEKNKIVSIEEMSETEKIKNNY